MDRSTFVRQLLFIICCASTSWAFAQDQCTDCTVSLPDDLPADTIYLSEAPDGRVGEPYAGDLHFRVPQTTTPVAESEGVPPGINISKFTIEGVNNVPPGLSWKASQQEFDLPDETDGCVRFCGTPLVPGLYIIEVVVTARVLVVDQQATFSIPLLIEPAQVVTEGFTANNTAGCGSVETEFINNVPSNGISGFSYLWEFGNGNVSLEEDPPAQLYDQAGSYPVNYQAIIDTAGYFLTSVKVTEVTCSDAFNAAPDLQLKVYDPDQNEIYSSQVRRDVRPPQEFTLNLKIGPGDYSITILDDDEGIFGGDKNCGTYNFNRESGGKLSDGDAQAEITIIHPVDTITASDTITVFELPETPQISAETERPCLGDTILLTSSSSTSNQWLQAGDPISGATSDSLWVHSSGEYAVQLSSEDGCRVVSAPVSLTFSTPPPEPVLVVENNLIQLADSMSLPTDIGIDWTFNGEPFPDAEGAAFCIRESGVYGIRLTDEQSGCTSSSEMEAAYDPQFAGCVSGRDAFDELVELVRLFPNPSTGPVLLEVQLRRADEVRLQLFDLTGRPLWQSHRRASAAKESWPLEFGEFPAGMYLLQVQTGGVSRGFRLVLEH